MSVAIRESKSRSPFSTQVPGLHGSDYLFDVSSALGCGSDRAMEIGRNIEGPGDKYLEKSPVTYLET